MGSKVIAGQALAIEMFITMVLLLAIFRGAADSGNVKTMKGSAPIAFGVLVQPVILTPCTACLSLDSLGPAIVTLATTRCTGLAFFWGLLLRYIVQNSAKSKKSGEEVGRQE